MICAGIRAGSLRALSVVTVLSLSAFAAPPPKSIAPAGTIEAAKSELRGWMSCERKSFAVIAATEGLRFGRLDVAKHTFTERSRLSEPELWPLAFSRDCRFVALGERAGTPEARTFAASLWSTEGDKLTRVAELSSFRLPPSAAAFSDDGRAIAVAANTGELVIFALDAKGGSKRVAAAAPLKSHEYLHLAWSHDSLLAGAYTGEVRLFSVDVQNGSLGRPIDLMGPTGPTRTSGSLDLATGDVVMAGGARVFEVAFTNDGKRAWAMVESGQVFSWELGAAPGERVTVVDHLNGGYGFAISADGALLVTVDNFDAQVWRLEGVKATLLGSLDRLRHAGKYVSARAPHFMGNALVVGTGDLSSTSLNTYSP